MEAGGRCTFSKQGPKYQNLSSSKGRMIIWGQVRGSFTLAGIQGEALRMTCRAPVGE